MTITYGFVSPKVRWISDDLWSCDRHTPPARIPGGVENCWYYGCPSCRPPRNGEILGTTLKTTATLKSDNWVSGWKSEPPVQVENRSAQIKKLPIIEEELIMDTPSPITEVTKEIPPKKASSKKRLLTLVTEDPVVEEPLIMDTPTLDPMSLIELQKDQAYRDVIAKALKEYQEKGPLSLLNESEASEPSAKPKNKKKASKKTTEKQLDAEVPTAAERKRGATQKVYCCICNKTLWRRPKDAAVRKIFWCAEHLNQKVVHP